MSQTETTAPQGHATHPLQPSMDTRYPPQYWYPPPPAVDHTPPPNPVVVIAVSLSPQKGESPHGAGVVLKSLHRDKQDLDSKGNHEDLTSDASVSVADFARNIIESVNAGKFLLNVCNRAGEGEALLPHGSVVKILYGNGYASTVRIQQEGVKKGRAKSSKKSDAETRTVMVGVSVLSDDVDRPIDFTADNSNDVSGFPVLLPDDAIIDHLKGGFVKIVLRTEGVYWLEAEHIIIDEESNASSGVAGVARVKKEQKSHSLEAWLSEANPGFLKKLVITKAAAMTPVIESTSKAAKIENNEKSSEPPALPSSKTEKKSKSRKRKAVKEPSEGETATQPDQTPKKQMKKATTVGAESQINAAVKSPKKTATAGSGSQKGLNAKGMNAAAAKSPKKTAAAGSGNQKESNVELNAEKPKKQRKKTSGAGSKVEELTKEPNAAKASAKKSKSAQSPKTDTKKPVPTLPSEAAQKKKSVAATKKTPSKKRGKAENEDSKQKSDAASSTSPTKATNTPKSKKDSQLVATEDTSKKRSRSDSRKKRADMTEEEKIQSRAEEREYRKELKRKKEEKGKKEKEEASAQFGVLC